MEYRKVPAVEAAALDIIVSVARPFSVPGISAAVSLRHAYWRSIKPATVPFWQSILISVPTSTVPISMSDTGSS
jgi:hypothetical protein